MSVYLLVTCARIVTEVVMAISRHHRRRSRLVHPTRARLLDCASKTIFFPFNVHV